MEVFLFFFLHDSKSKFDIQGWSSCSVMSSRAKILSVFLSMCFFPHYGHKEAAVPPGIPITSQAERR